MKTNGGELLTSSVQTVCEMYPSLSRAGRLQIPSSNSMPAHLFPSPAKLKKGKGEGRCLGGEMGWVKHQHPQLKALLAQGHGTEPPGTLGMREMAPGLLQGQSLGLGIVWEEGTGPVRSPVSRGQAWFHGALDQGLTQQAKRDLYFDPISII